MIAQGRVDNQLGLTDDEIQKAVNIVTKSLLGYLARGIDRDDLRGVCGVAVSAAIAGYDPYRVGNRNAMAYLVHFGRLRARNILKRRRHYPDGLNLRQDFGNDNPIDEFAHARDPLPHDNMVAEELLLGLTRRERALVLLRARGAKLSLVGRWLGISQQRAAKIAQEIRDKILAREGTT